IRRRPSAQREIRLDARRQVVEAERREQLGEAPAVIGGRIAQRHEPLSRGRAQSRPLEALLEIGPSPLELPEREVQPPAPFAERSLRLREQPWDTADARKVDAAAGAAKPFRRLV